MSRHSVAGRNKLSSISFIERQRERERYCGQAGTGVWTAWSPPASSEQFSWLSAVKESRPAARHSHGHLTLVTASQNGPQ